MQIQADYVMEKSELETVLASGIFERAPNLVHILTYVCSKYFQGLPDEIKEYNIAVEALGRPPDFDQKRDSIVRVEVHRLRKRLRDYYQNEGAEHAVHIEIPVGQYAPRFLYKGFATVRRQEQTSLAAPPADLAPAEVSQPENQIPETQVVALEQVLPSAAKPFAGRRWPMVVSITAGLILASAAFWQMNKGPVQSRSEMPPLVAGDEIRILAGVLAGGKGPVAASGNYVDGFNRVWSADRFFSGGSIVEASPEIHPIAGTRDSHIYQSRREGTFSYDIPVPPGVYELHLHFAEVLYGDNNIAGGGETSRIFQVSANGKPLLTDFDVIADAGPSTADVKIFKDLSPASDGKLHLRFEAGTNPAFLNAIEILPGIPGKMRPVRMVSRDRGFGDKSGRYWDSDRYVRGGQLVLRTEPVSGTPDPDLYRGERFGNITYTIPVVQQGRYLLRLYFAESWFGPGRPGGAGERSRIFDILCNGIALKRNVDIFKEAGGANRALVLSFHDLQPTPQGKLVISLVPSRNYASINAIEIEEEVK